ncbi:actin depolymerizing [Pyrrhoderma noxium]|uniref:Actin depolymerizing n=1 Tax=Pyrrhoderma noxium TaxID=2282107 RepID=A0A286UWE1_9AGAM|nr:actin depolymerizing [Pyrrhoderma noxium]
MSASSGIGVSRELTDVFASSVDAGTTRFIKVVIEKESLIAEEIVDASERSLEDDIEILQDIVDENTPAYILARIGSPGDGQGWLAISYVPDTATIRGKMLYASSRNALTRSLGSAHFPDALFATSKADLTLNAYKAHKAHNAAPQPLSAREQELADARAMERAAGSSYEGTRGRLSHVGDGFGLAWTAEVEDAVRTFGKASRDAIILLSIDPKKETLTLLSSSDCKISELSSKLPSSEPSYAFFAWTHNYLARAKREIILIYSCPSGSPVKNRMIFSSGVTGVQTAAQRNIFPPDSFNDRRIETSDPTEVDEQFIISKLGYEEGSNAKANTSTAQTSFARPKGPGRRR